VHGLAKHIGSIEVGKLADFCLWSPAFFGVRPDLVIKCGTIAAAPMGDPNASIPTPQPVHYRPMFGAFGKSLTESAVTFVSRAALEAGIGDTARAHARPCCGREHAWRHRQGAMIHNSATPEIEVDPETYEVRADGELLTCAPADVLPMAQRYFLF
jgi:urease subunit alpha